MTKVLVNMFFANFRIDKFWRHLGSIMGPSGQYWRFLAKALCVSKGTYLSWNWMKRACVFVLVAAF